VSLGVAILGAGWAGAMHARAARGAGLAVVGVAARDGDKARAFAAEHAIALGTDDWRALVARADVDLVVIATPNVLHQPQALHALAERKHVLVEKPMALSVEAGAAMIAAAHAARRVLAVGHMWRYRAEVIDLRERIAAGDCGRIIRTHGFGVHAHWGPSGWFIDPALAGGGALIDMGIHAIDTARFLLGDPAPRRVSASIGVGAFGDYAVDDDGLVVVDWEGGVRSLIEFGWNQPSLGGLEAETRVIGSRGAARIWPDMPPAAVGYQHCSVEMYQAQIADVAHCCRSGGTPRASAAGGLIALEIVQSAYAAARCWEARNDAR
jgi:predicted dehydrogenase